MDEQKQGILLIPIVFVVVIALTVGYILNAVWRKTEKYYRFSVYYLFLVEKSLFQLLISLACPSLG